MLRSDVLLLKAGSPVDAGSCYGFCVTAVGTAPFPVNARLTYADGSQEALTVRSGVWYGGREQIIQCLLTAPAGSLTQGTAYYVDRGSHPDDIGAPAAGDAAIVQTVVLTQGTVFQVGDVWATFTRPHPGCKALFVLCSGGSGVFGPASLYNVTYGGVRVNDMTGGGVASPGNWLAIVFNPMSNSVFASGMVVTIVLYSTLPAPDIIVCRNNAVGAITVGAPGAVALGIWL